MGYNKRFIEKDKDQMVIDYAFIKALKLQIKKTYVKKD